MLRNGQIRIIQIFVELRKKLWSPIATRYTSQGPHQDFKWDDEENYDMNFFHHTTITIYLGILELMELLYPIKTFKKMAKTSLKSRCKMV